MPPRSKHTPECLAQNANTLFGDLGPYICPKPPSCRTKAKTPTQANAKTEAKSRVPNPCYGAERRRVVVPTEHFRVPLLFAPSNAQLSAYALSQRHKVPTARAAADPDTHPDEIVQRDTFDDDAIETLLRRYPKDPLYPRVRQYRVLEKALGTYLKKLQPGSKLLGEDGILRDAFRHTPKTLRLAMELLQVLPRGGDGSVYDEIRQCLVPRPGHTFIARDYSNIEPLLVAYFARDAHFLRACRVSSHSWFAANVIGQPPDFAWSDADIAEHYATLAASGPYTVSGTPLTWKDIRNGCKTAGMASLYAGGPGEIARARPDLFPSVKIARYYQDAFFALCPRVRQWHWETAETAEREEYLTTPIGFRLHYYDLFAYRWVPSSKRWTKSLNAVAKEAIASVPQHTGAMYLTTAMVTLGDERPDLAEYMRLLIHDELFSEVPDAEVEMFDATLREIMERPHPLMPLWPEAVALTGDTHLRVVTDAKHSPESWGAMKG